MSFVATTTAPCAARVTAALPVRSSTVRPARFARLVAVRAEPSSVERAIKEAEESCREGSAEECANAWDTVEELSADASHKKTDEKKDPLDAYCEEVPEADECKVYDDV